MPTWKRRTASPRCAIGVSPVSSSTAPSSPSASWINRADSRKQQATTTDFPWASNSRPSATALGTFTTELNCRRAIRADISACPWFPPSDGLARVPMQLASKSFSHHPAYIIWRTTNKIYRAVRK